MATGLLLSVAPGSHVAAQPVPGADDNYVLAESWPLPLNPIAPIDVGLGPEGRLYVADGGRNAVLAYGPDGSLRGRWDLYDYPAFQPDPMVLFVPLVLAVDGARGKVHIIWQRYDQEPGGPVARIMYLDSRPLDGGAPYPLAALSTNLTTVTDMMLDETSGDLFLLASGVVRRFKMGTQVLDSVTVGNPASGARAIAVTYDGRIAMAAPDSNAVGMFRQNGQAIGVLDLERRVPLALAADGAGNLLVLVQAPNPDNPTTPLVLVFDPAGNLIEQRSIGELRAASPGAKRWPWALAVTPDGLALSTGNQRFLVQWYAASGELRGRLVGGRVQPAFTAHASEEATRGGLALAMSSEGDLLALDGPEARVVRFGPTGGLSLVTGVPDGAQDLAAAADGTLYVSTAGGQVMQLAAGDAVTPTWSVDCNCDLGGRLGVGGTVLYVSRPRQHSVATFDTMDGLALREIRLDGTVGLWPSDLSVGRDGRLFTGDLTTAQVQVWRLPTAPEVSWQAGLLSGPRRLTGGFLADGSPVVAGIMADGFVELHTPSDGSLIARWRPVLPTGGHLEVADIALGRDGRIFLADAVARKIRVFEPGIGIPPIQETPLAITPTPGSNTCRIRGDKWAAPSQAVLGGTFGVTLTLSAVCPSNSKVIGADIVLVMDRSSSMRGTPMETAKAAARAFTELLDVRYHRVGLASFSSLATLDVPLTSSIPGVIDGIEALDAGGETNISAGIERAFSNLQGFGRPDALPVIVLLTDGQYSSTTADPRIVATAARAWGAQIYAIGLGNGVDAGVLGEIAGSPERYFAAPTPSELFPIYSQILRQVLSSFAGNLIVDDAIADTFSYVDRSAQPQALVAPGRLRWGRSLLPAGGITLTYQLVAGAPGCRATNRQAVADYTDVDGASRRYTFPIPTVCVVTPSPTPTAPPTPTSTPTPEPGRAFLPLLYKNKCVPSTQHADVAVVIDTSESMAGVKLASAKDAARLFVSLLDLPADQGTVIGFSTDAKVIAPLTGDRAALTAAIDRLATARGTRIDRALLLANRELRSVRHVALHRNVIVLLSDGAHNGPPEDVVAAARKAVAEAGAVIYAIGLGQDADLNLLRQVAGQARTYAAPNPEELAGIYREIAVTIPCR